MRIIIILGMFFLTVSCGSDKKEQENQQPIIFSALELKTKSLDELRLLRNEIFARKGYKFNSEDLRKHFSSFEWYKPKYDNVDSILSDIDKKNIQTILVLERNKKEVLEHKKLRISDIKLSKLKKAYSSAENRNKLFIEKVLLTISQFNDHLADTTILTIGNIDGLDNLDTIYTHVYALDDTIYVKSKWIRNEELLWSGTIKNPYIYINDDDLFAYDTRHPWVTFTIGVMYGPPDIVDKSSYVDIDKALALKMARYYINKNNLQIAEKDYSDYLDSFNGKLLSYGDPEVRHQLMLWYEPQKKFILYYAP